MNSYDEDDKEIFLSTPISSFGPDEFQDFKTLFNALHRAIELNNPEYRVFCAAESISSLDVLDDLKYSAINDFQRIENCIAFVLFYPKQLATSALVELGYALALKKSILIITPRKETLPFLCRKMDVVYDFVDIQSTKIEHQKVVELIGNFIDKKILPG